MSFIKGFLSIFDWMFPKTLDESLNDLDDQMQDLYNKMGWGKYNNPCAAHNHAIDLTRIINRDAWQDLIKDNKTVEQVYGSTKIVTSSQFLDEMIKLVPSGQFIPCAYYNEDMDSIQVYFKDTSSYTQPLNQNVEIHLSHDADEITGATILNIKQLIKGSK